MSYREKQERIVLEVTKTDVETAKGAIAWVKSLKDTKMSDYLWNLYVAIEAGYVNSKTCNLVASAVVAYQREIAKRLESSRPSKHLGTVGERETFTVKLLRCIPIEGNYGTSYLHGFEDAEGNALVWFGSSLLRYGEDRGCNPVAVGDTVTINGMVSEHGQYKGRNQTSLKRVKLHVEKAKKARKSKKVEVEAAPVAAA